MFGDVEEEEEDEEDEEDEDEDFASLYCSTVFDTAIHNKWEIKK